jgi:hypothetical protein
MLKIENPFKNIVVAGAIAMNAAACAPGAGEKSGAMTPQDSKMESVAENSPEAVQKRLLDGMKVGMNDMGDGKVVLVAMKSGFSIDVAEKFAREDLKDMKSDLEGVVFLPTSGAPKVEKASDGNFYVVMKIIGSKL